MTDLIHIMYMDMSLLEERKTNDIVAKILFLVPHLILCRSPYLILHVKNHIFMFLKSNRCRSFVWIL